MNIYTIIGSKPFINGVLYVGFSYWFPTTTLIYTTIKKFTK